MTSSAWLRLGRPLDPFLVVAGGDASERDIVARGEVVAHEILEDDAHAAAQLFDVVFAEVMAVEQDAALVRVVQTCQQLHQGGLAGAVLAHQRHHLARLEGEAEMAHRPARGAGIDEADILEDEALAQRPGQRTGILRRQDPGLHLEEREEVVEIERLARRRREAHQQRFQKGAQAAERGGEKAEIADGEFALQGAPHDIGVGQVVARGADGREHAAPARPAQRDRAVGRIEGLGQPPVVIDQETVEAEDLHFLGGLDAGRRQAYIVEFATLRRVEKSSV